MRVSLFRGGIMKKVLYVVEAFGGGVFTFMVDLINSISKDYEVVLACSIRPQTPKNYKEYLNDNVKIIELQNGERSINLKKDLKFFFEINSIIKKENPDILHLHSSKAGFLGRLATNDRERKIFYNPHGYSFLKQDEKFSKKTLYKVIELLASKKSGYIIGCSKGEYEEALKLSKKAYLINNGINIEKLPHYKDKPINKKNLKICTVGRICFQKNPEVFNEIANHFKENEFIWIGDGELKDKITSPNIKITGWVTKNDALKNLSECDIFLLPSLWEGLPIALLEAMYYKKICIVSNSIGNRDVINTGVNGFIANSVEDYIKVINDIANSKIDIDKIKDNEYRDILDHYNFNITSKQYKQLYN